jgi:hypothetical protein
MKIGFRQFTAFSALVLIMGGLAGCGTINSTVTPAIVDAIPQWAGGMPADVPPRPGTAKYDEFMRERERKRLLPAVKEDSNGGSPTAMVGNSTSVLPAVH